MGIGTSFPGGFQEFMQEIESGGVGAMEMVSRDLKADKIGLRKHIGWHTFRHTFGTILNANGENPKVIQELMRHANLKVTMDTYVQAVTDEKREAQNKVVKMLLPGIRRAVI